MLYNWYDNLLVSETSLTVGFLCNGQRYQKNHAFLRGSDSDPLRRNGYFPTVLSKVGPQRNIATAYPMAAKKQYLSSSRTPAEHDLYDGRGDGTYLRYPDYPIQWLLPRVAGIERFPETFDLERIPEGNKFGGVSRHYPCARFAAQENLELAASFQQSHLRSGFDRPAGIWLENRRSQSWIQPRQAWASQLSSFDLLRRAYPGYLVRPLASRGYLFRERSSSALVGLPKENSQISLPRQNSVATST